MPVSRIPRDFTSSKSFFRGANPCRYLGEFVAQSHAFLKRAPVLFRVDEELRLADYALLTAETMQHFVQVDDLLTVNGFIAC